MGPDLWKIFFCSLGDLVAQPQLELRLVIFQ